MIPDLLHRILNLTALYECQSKLYVLDMMGQCRDIPTSTNENQIGRYAAVELLMSVPMFLTYWYSLVKAITLEQILNLRRLTKH